MQALTEFNNKIKYYLGKVESVDENYIVTFSIPNILDNLDAYPTAYPKHTDHTREILIGDSILIEQLDSSIQFFMYVPVNRNSNTGIYFGNVRIDITDGKTIHIDTGTIQLTIDGESNKMFIGNDSYSLNQWMQDMNTALQSLHTEGSPGAHTATSWYNSSVQTPMRNIQNIFPSDISYEKYEPRSNE